MVARAAVELVARADRRPDRRRARAVGLGRRRVARRRAQGRDPGVRRADDRVRRRPSSLLLAIFWVFQRMPSGAGEPRPSGSGSSFSGTFVAFTHGANDAQKTMGVIALALFSNGSIDHFYIPTWVKVAAGLAIAAGTYVGGWRIMRTLGQRLYKMEPRERLRRAGDRRRGDLRRDPRSATRSRRRTCISGAVLGAGSTKRFSRRALGRRREHRRRLGPDDPGGRARRRRRSTGRSRRSSNRSFTERSPFPMPMRSALRCKLRGMESQRTDIGPPSC